MRDIESDLRLRQQWDPVLGPLFTVAYAYCRAQVATEHLIGGVLPLIRFEAISGPPRGSYAQTDSALLRHVVTVDPWKVRNGPEMAEVLAHELTHMQQVIVDGETGHGPEFDSLMRRLGLWTIEGRLVERMPQWDVWLIEIGDIGLDDIMFEEGEPV